MLDLARGFDGLYFETGQGSAVTNGAAEGVDMVTLEARAYGVRHGTSRRPERAAPWMIVNDVAGFIGPEVFATASSSSARASRTSVMAKLHGLTMGLDVCATFHMGIAPAALRAAHRAHRRARRARLSDVGGRQRRPDARLSHDVVSRAPAAPRGDRPADRRPPMEHRLTALGVIGRDGEPRPARRPRSHVSTRRTRGPAAIGARPRRSRRRGAGALHELRERGFDLGDVDAAGRGRAARGDLRPRARRAVCHRSTRA